MDLNFPYMMLSENLNISNDSICHKNTCSDLYFQYIDLKNDIALWRTHYQYKCIIKGIFSIKDKWLDKEKLSFSNAVKELTLVNKFIPALYLHLGFIRMDYLLTVGILMGIMPRDFSLLLKYMYKISLVLKLMNRW